MSIEELISVVEPPDPWEGGDEKKWEEVQAKLGIALPSDYMEFGLRYGTGTFVDNDRLSITVYNPFSTEYHEKVISKCEMLRPFGGEQMPDHFFPTRPGLLPWGWDDNGYTFYWLTEGSPDRWAILFHPPREFDSIERVEMSLTTFLALAFSGELETHWGDAPFFRGPEPVQFSPRDCPYFLDHDWLTPTVQEVAAAIREGSSFHRLPILADALEDAGCTNDEILKHCRSGLEHVRGCWLIDLVLGKE